MEFEPSARITLFDMARLERELSELIGLKVDLRTAGDLSRYFRRDELVLFDPCGDYLKPRLRGFRLEQGRYQEIPPNPDGSLDLETTGLTARPEGERLRLVDTATGEKLLWGDELEAARQAEATARRAAEERAVAAETRVAEEAAARQAAEERACSLAEELARLRGRPNP